MATSGKQLAAKLFLEGIEVPFIGATVTYSVNQASIAYIDLVPHAIINAIKARTLVTLSVRDYNNDKDGNPFVTAWEGEVFGFSFGKTPTSRTFSISCIDKSSYWDNVLTYFFNAQQSLGKGAENLAAVAQDAADANKQGINNTAVTHSVSSYFIQVMKKYMNGNNENGVPADFLDGLIGVYKSISNVNDFYNLAESRLRITDRIRLYSSGQLSNLLKQSEALEWFTGIIGRQSGFQTLRMVLQDLMSVIFHDGVTVPFPSVVQNKNVVNSLTPHSKPSTTIGEFVFKPNLYMLPPPICNIFFPDEYSSYQFSRNFFQEPTRLIYKPEMPNFGTTSVSLTHVYQPDSFSYFMGGKNTVATYPADTVGAADIQVSAKDTPGKFGDSEAATSPYKASNNGKKREQQFLTNEEKLKGILMSQETMVPAASQFRIALSDVGRKTYYKGIAKYLFYKKRFQGRDLQITSHLKMSVVPGFPVMILDDSDAEQSVVAYCSSVTHRIYATQGGYTNTTLSYARSVTEQDQTSNKAGEPLIPPWFASEIFGSIASPPKSKQKKVNTNGNQLVVPQKLSTFYASLLGQSGSKSINDYMNEPTLLGASSKLIDQYKLARKKGTDATHALIDKTTRRDYVTLQQSFSFLGATTTTKDYTTPFMQFNGARLDGQTGTTDADQIKLRQDVITAYRDILKKQRGFRG